MNPRRLGDGHDLAGARRCVLCPWGAKDAGLVRGLRLHRYIDYPIAVRHIPWLFALLVVLAEFFSALGLIAGLCARVAAFGVGAVMVVAVAEVHIHYGFFMNWNSNKPAEGFEFFLLGLAMAIAVMLKGAGAFSLDRLLCGRLSRRSPAPGMQADARAA